MNVEIIRLDDNGRGIGYIDGKIIFVPKTLPGDIVNVKITLDKKKYFEGTVIEFIKESELRIESECPYFNVCGGCQYMNLSYEDSVNIKVNNFINNLKRSNLNNNVNIVKNENIKGYRNKVSLKIRNSKLGFFEKESNTLVEIDKCLLASDVINKYINHIKDTNIKNGNVILRSNYLDNIFIIINTEDNVNLSILENEDVHGIMLNDNLVYGSEYFEDKVNDLKFEISHDSFFQINPYITSEVFKVIENNITKDDIVLDLYCGVGSLSLVAAKNARKVYGIEIVKNAIINAKNNALINGFENTEFFVGDLNKLVKLKDDVNTFIVDPPRSGLGKAVKDKIKEVMPEKIIYMSCNPNTLIRDLKELEDLYKIEEITAFDMFSYTSHLESICILKRKQNKCSILC